jgi:phosphoribosylformimino-5-aminoimidazole carboxamide ribotide isomerase
VQIYPAIDLRGGQCVRLRQGDYEQETVFGSDPAAMARRWVDDGATYLHLVDLDGARDGRPVNGASVRAIVAAAGVPCQMGGGVRTEADVAEVLGWGVSRVIIGTKALTSPTWRRFQELPLAALVYTDISRDGMMQGVNAEAMAEMVAATKLPVIASGGVTTLDDIRRLAAIPTAGAIVGRALYEGGLKLPQILLAAAAGAR